MSSCLALQLRAIEAACRAVLWQVAVARAFMLSPKVDS